jgi:hypothetical protein
VPFETSGQAEQVGVKWIGMLSRQVEVALTGIVDALADGRFDDIDPDRYRDIPLRVDSPSWQWAAGHRGGRRAGAGRSLRGVPLRRRADGTFARGEH